MIYNINIDEKLTIWARNKLTIEAETEEEAVQKAVEMVKNGVMHNSYDELVYPVKVLNAIERSYKEKKEIIVE